MVLKMFLIFLFYIGFIGAYQVPFCFSQGFTWSSRVAGGVQSVETPEECQQICADSSDCDSVTWYDGQASPHPDYCEMFLAPDYSSQITCSNCTSGPESCMCSGSYTCSLDSDHLVELVFEMASEIGCAELCFKTSECKYYSWYCQNHPILKETCALLSGCSERTGSKTCHSGPSDCSDIDIMDSNYPMCYDVGLTWSEDILKGVANISSAYICQEMCSQDENCSSFTWFNPTSEPYPYLCEFYAEGSSEPTRQCSDCVSGPATCTCSVSNHQTCDTSKEPVIDIFTHIKSEVQCQDICARNTECEWYTYYSEEGDRLKSTCILLESCYNKMECKGCSSGPERCQSIHVIRPQCFDYRELDSYTRNVLTPRNNLCNGQTCCDDSATSHAPNDWAGEGWYRFTGAAGNQIATSIPVYAFCGTDCGGYLTDGHPAVEDGVVSRTVDFSCSGSTDIKIINCKDYYIYHLKNVPGCNRGFCGE